MQAVRRLPTRLFRIRRQEMAKAAVMGGLFFLIIGTLGVLKPIRNAFALDGLAESQFYTVYLVSAAVVLFVVPYSRLADRVPWRGLIPGMAVFFALNLMAFRLFYREASTVFGLVFYGWYDLYSAVMVTQFFMATQLLLNARDAKRLYPFAIAGGSLGGVSGSALTGFFAPKLGAPNLLLVAGVLVLIFAAATPLAWAGASDAIRAPSATSRQERYTAGRLKAILRNKHVLLIATSVLLTVLVKQLVDYQFNELTSETFQNRDAIGAFQGKFFAAVQWLPLLVLLGLRPLLRRWGVGLVILLLPALLLITNLVLALTWSLAWAVIGKAGDNAFRHTAERAGREILYVPLPDGIKLKAKAYIDMALEKGLAKAAAAGLIFLAVSVIDYRRVGYVGAGIAAAWVAVVVAVRAEYVASLARSIRGRFASFAGTFASMSDATTTPLIRQALSSGDERSIAFALDLIQQADPAGARPLTTDVHELLDHGSPRIREGALGVLADFPDDIELGRVYRRLDDPDAAVRRAAVKTLCQVDKEPQAVMKSLLDSRRRPVRVAALDCLLDDAPAEVSAEVIDSSYLDGLECAAAEADAPARIELALALGTIRAHPRTSEFLRQLLNDPESEVVEAAIRTVGRLRLREFYPRVIRALASADTREAARQALSQGPDEVTDLLMARLRDESEDPAVRRNIPGVLARLPSQHTVSQLLDFLLSAPSDRLVRQRALKALNKLRARGAELDFDRGMVMRALGYDLEDVRRYAEAKRILHEVVDPGPVLELLGRAVEQAWENHREMVFRYLGLLYPPAEIYRAYLTLQNGGLSARATALEWLEETLGYANFRKLAPAFRDEEWTEAEEGHESPGSLPVVLRELIQGDNTWLAVCAAWAAAELGTPWAREALEEARRSAGTEVSYIAEGALMALDDDALTTHKWSGGEMNLIEKVFLLQQVDLLQDARTDDLALLASIAEEVEVKTDTVLLQQGEPTDALYIVIRGAVELRRAEERVLTAQDGTPFGTWALIDESPSLVTAKTARETELLRITREDFYDLLAEHNELVRDLLRGLARRVRTLVA